MSRKRRYGLGIEEKGCLICLAPHPVQMVAEAKNGGDVEEVHPSSCNVDSPTLAAFLFFLCQFFDMILPFFC